MRVRFALCSLQAPFPYRYVFQELSPVNVAHATLCFKVCFQRIHWKTSFFALCPLGAQFTEDPEVEFGRPESGRVSFFPVGLVLDQLVLVGSFQSPRVTLSAPWSPLLQRSAKLEGNRVSFQFLTVSWWPQVSWVALLHRVCIAFQGLP